ncbi:MULTISPECIES: hypothetical protein [Enterococcus]|uniref:Uncharacterized protein n=1 Tax=Candidatus Enterococcus lemimoniae TaxID=1834167 RepID=A0ABZ2T6B8_9ENTE|nr:MULTISPECIES: hypothetical protein [unclassified Enterococcus]OTN88989.1 hypothetical protein A5819_001481 [Enterococcus sp. 7E2_DIV0204]OTO67842.1 hypothetical protein A5866_000037 [Enterococcus sp. 12C11_DIV0727]OTP51446.1 hypothetical protein A5884_000641 [Enterococcus sp. 7D2_DIV0200]
MVNPDLLKQDLADALNAHIKLLREVEQIEVDHMDAFTFMMRSFGFMLDRSPKVLLGQDNEALNYMMFQYYSLLTELKYNLILNYPYARLQGKTMKEVVEVFPTTYEREMKQWWEEKTGLAIEETKQTILIKELDY